MCGRILLVLTLFIYSLEVYPSQVGNVKSIGEQIELIISSHTLVEDKSQALLGVDLNSNKIRDDVDEVLSQLAMSEVDKEFITRYIKYSFGILAYDFSKNMAESRTFANSIYEELAKVRHCYKQTGVDGKDLYDSINAINILIFNTYERIVAYFNYESYIDVLNTNDKIVYDC
ncbi:chromosome segregation ATPase [Vibrio sp. 10N.222.47.A9]|nr:chromosome segregation ATPase [Vibrio sp. 10N.222.47.A9]